MINEAILRSPKWLRNFADFEINTGEDIKGEPSLKRQKEIEIKEEEERRIKNEKDAEERKRKEKEFIEKERERIKAAEEKNSKEFDTHFRGIIDYIYTHYKECKMGVPNASKFTIEKDDLRVERLDFKFRVTLDDTIVLPKFIVYIAHGTKNYNYTVTGTNYTQFKIFLINTVYPWYRKEGYKKDEPKAGQKSGPKSSDKKYSSWDPYGEDEWRGEEPPKTTKPLTAEENKRRRYDLLMDTKDGYVRKWNNIMQWERQNPGKVHPEKAETRIMIDNVKDKIQKMKDAYHFESLKHLKSYKLYENDNWWEKNNSLEEKEEVYDSRLKFKIGDKVYCTTDDNIYWVTRAYVSPTEEKLYDLDNRRGLIGEDIFECELIHWK